MTVRCIGVDNSGTRCSLAAHPDTIACYFSEARSMLAIPELPAQAEQRAAQAISLLAAMVGFADPHCTPIDVIVAARTRIEELARMCEQLAGSVSRSELVGAGERIAVSLERVAVQLERLFPEQKGTERCD